MASELRNYDQELFWYQRRLTLAAVIVVLCFLTLLGRFVYLQVVQHKHFATLAEANRIDYHVADKKIDMMGNVSVQRNQDLFTGDVLHYDIQTKSLSAAGDNKTDGRVHAVIYPKKTISETPSQP